MVDSNFALLATIVVSLVNLGVTIFGGFAFLMTIKSRQAVQDVLLAGLSKSIERLDTTLEDLRRGNGWIKAPLNRAVDEEY
jgi:hypothetical protein